MGLWASLKPRVNVSYNELCSVLQIYISTVYSYSCLMFDFEPSSSADHHLGMIVDGPYFRVCEFDYEVCFKDVIQCQAVSDLSSRCYEISVCIKIYLYTRFHKKEKC